MVRRQRDSQAVWWSCSRATRRWLTLLLQHFRREEGRSQPSHRGGNPRAAAKLRCMWAPVRHPRLVSALRRLPPRLGCEGTRNGCAQVTRPRLTTPQLTPRAPTAAHAGDFAREARAQTAPTNLEKTDRPADYRISAHSMRSFGPGAAVTPESVSAPFSQQLGQCILVAGDGRTHQMAYGGSQSARFEAVDSSPSHHQPLEPLRV